MADLVSAIVPIYNHAQYLEQCLDSIYNDNYPNIELIIVDDGSKDESLEIAKKWRESHPGRFHRFHLETQENQGICKTLNKLVSLAEGEYVFPLASDDYLLPGGVKLRIEALEAHPEWLAVFGDTTIVDETNKLLFDSGIEFYGGNKKILANQRFIKREMILNWSIPGPVFLARRSVYDDKIGIGLYDENLYGEDADFYYRLLARNLLGFVDAKVSAYRFVTNSMSRNEISRGKALGYWKESCTKNLDRFDGLNKFCLWFLSMKLTIDTKYSQRRIIDKVIRKPGTIILKFIYFIHTTNFFFKKDRLSTHG